MTIVRWHDNSIVNTTNNASNYGGVPNFGGSNNEIP